MPLKHPQMTITDFNYESSYLSSLTCNMDVRVDIGRSTGRSTPPQGEASNGQEWQVHIATVRAHIGRSNGRSTPPRSTNGSAWQFFCLSSYWQIKWQVKV